MVKKGAAVDTAATELLGAEGVPYAIHQYAASKSAVGADDPLPVDAFDYPERVYRTEMPVADGRALCALVPINTVLDELLVAAAVGANEAVEPTPELVKKLMAYPLDALTPLGTRLPLACVLDVSALDYRTIYISAGEPGFVIELSPGDLLRLTGGRTAPIARRL
jgi:Cys-tRNA(Pro)/Cys-tRNA(Cys) deacylase